jgi:predicted transposase YbfD/YdcC
MIVDKIVAHKADFLLALKGNQPTLEADVEDYFRTAPAAETVTKTTVEKGYGRMPRFANIKTTLFAVPRHRAHRQRHRSHWGVESMHWLLDVEFKDDLSRYRTGHGAKNMAISRRFALGLVRADKSTGSVKTRRKTASWSPDFLLQIVHLN